MLESHQKFICMYVSYADLVCSLYFESAQKEENISKLNQMECKTPVYYLVLSSYGA